MMNNQDLPERTMRTITSKFETREENSEPRIEGYFADFSGVYEIAPGLTESIDSGAFNNALADDIRALTDHNTAMVLGRNKSHTLELKVDSHGLWGSILINPKDQDAMNLYERVKRGDVNQCSFGFDILNEDTDARDDGSVHWTIRKVKLYEVSVCTFPAYDTTEVTARSKDAETIRYKVFVGWQQTMRSKHQYLKKEEKNA